jgi:hypothetical protein
MRWLTLDATLVCKHELGNVRIEPTQDLVTVEGRRVLVATDPEAKPIVGCPNVGAAIKPCTQTLAVEQGYSSLLRIAWEKPDQRRRVCLDTVEGLTDGTPPGTVKYKVRDPGQDVVEEIL